MQIREERNPYNFFDIIFKKTLMVLQRAIGQKSTKEVKLDIFGRKK